MSPAYGGGPKQPTGVRAENENSRNPQRVRLHRGRNVPAGKVGHGVAQPTPRAKRQSEGIKRTQREEMVPGRIHHRHSPYTDDPYERLERHGPTPDAEPPTPKGKSGRFRPD